MDSKVKQIRDFIQREAKHAIGAAILDMQDGEAREKIRANRSYLAQQIAWHITEEYRLLELMDIMEWKRQRVRR